jgi:hypothetical protein
MNSVIKDKTQEKDFVTTYIKKARLESRGNHEKNGKIVFVQQKARNPKLREK